MSEGPLNPRAAHQRWTKLSSSGKMIFAAVAAYVTLTAAYVLWHRTFLSPDQFFILVLLVSVLIGRVRSFLWDWLPLVVLLFGYEYVRGLVPLVNSHVHYQAMIDFDRSVFGTVPTLALQSRFYHPGDPAWYDYAAVICYLSHFIVPLGAAFLLWLYDRKMFREFAAGILILSYAAFLTYLIFPAAPPWMAAQVSLLPKVDRILGNTLLQFRDPISLPTVYAALGVNMVAAVPSLHAAFPLLTALFIGEKQPKLLPLLAVYVFSIWIAVIYLGEHYVFDVAAGIVYAVLTYLLVFYWPAIKACLKTKPR